MGYILLAPEMVIIWAGRQHYAARNFAKKHQENTGWTRAHAFFLIMGGFTLHEGGKPVRVLEARDLEELSEAGKIEWPTITEEEIADRSKGDYLSKAIVLFQTTWFIGQCIARGAYRLVVTELEVVTLAFAILTGVIYYFWWDKPLDVRCSIPVQLLDGHVGKEDTGFRIIPPPEVAPQEKEITVLPNTLLSTRIQVDKSTPDPALINTSSHIVPSQEVSDQGMPQGDEKVVDNADPPPSTSIQVNSSTPDPALTRMERFQAFRRRSRKKHGTLLGLGYVFIVFPLERFFDAFYDMGMCSTLGNKTLRVPTFYSLPDDEGNFDGAAIIVGMCISIVFGAIHCIAWSFHFATLPERWAWRISAILVSGLPIAISAFTFLVSETFNKDIYKGFPLFILISMLCLYIIARIVLLVLPFMALRALPPGAYVQLDWVSFLPHI